MFTYLTRYLGRLDSQPVRTVAFTAVGVLVLSVILASVIAWLRRRGQDGPERWPALITGSIGAVLKVLIGLAILAAMALHLSFQSAEFARLRGGITQRSYEAVKTIWGRPHLQRELRVRLIYYTTHIYDKDGMEVDPEKLKASTQPIGFRKAKVEHTVPGNPIIEADHTIELWMNYRKKGGAYYPCFETNCRFTYRVVNFSDQKASVQFNFPLPERQGLIDNLKVTLDGKDPHKPLVVTGGLAQWWSEMTPGQKHDVIVSYHSRGLDHLRFEPGSGRQLRKYRIRMKCTGVAKKQLNYPIGCMTPMSVEEGQIEVGQDPKEKKTLPQTTLLWNLDSAVTRLGMGVIVPAKKQEGYYVARALAAAPWGLVLLLAMVIITHLATGQSIRWVPLLLLAVGYHLYYLLMAHVGDYAPGLTGGMLISGAALTALIVLLEFTRARGFTSWATVVMFVLFCSVYPLIRISSCSGLLLTILYVVLLAYTIFLLVRKRLRPSGN